jgi:hypothetical protein
VVAFLYNENKYSKRVPEHNQALSTDRAPGIRESSGLSAYSAWSGYLDTFERVYIAEKREVLKTLSAAIRRSTITFTSSSRSKHRTSRMNASPTRSSSGSRIAMRILSAHSSSTPAHGSSRLPHQASTRRSTTTRRPSNCGQRPVGCRRSWPLSEQEQTEWRQRLGDPTVAGNIELLGAGDGRDAVETFLKSKSLPDPISPAFVKALREILSGLERVVLTEARLRLALTDGGVPCTVGELKERFDAFISELTKGKDSFRVRIVTGLNIQ